jgi:hypothetical protein
MIEVVKEITEKILKYEFALILKLFPKKKRDSHSQ